MKELPFWALFFSLEDKADIANTTHFCEVWKRQEFEVPPSAFGHSQHHSASSSFSCCLGGLGICKFLFQDPPTFRAGEEFARLSGPDAAVRKCCPMPRLQKQAAEHRMPAVGYEWSETQGHYDLDICVPDSLRWFPGQHRKQIGHRYQICILSILLGTLGDMSESKAKKIEIKDVDGQTLSKLIDYIYTAEIEVTEENVQVISAADPCAAHSVPVISASCHLTLSAPQRSLQRKPSCRELSHFTRVTWPTCGPAGPKCLCLA